MWFDDLSKDSSWAALWHGYVLCGSCGGIRTVSGPCPGCNEPGLSTQWTKFRTADGTELEVPPTFAGAEGRYEDWVFLMLLEREWKRAAFDEDPFLKISESSRPSPRAVLVLLFWTYFETRIERLLRQSMLSLPERVSNDLLQRNGSIGSRLERLYKILFNATYWSDLTDLGYSSIAALLRNVQQSRNRFMHGDPAAIDDALVTRVAAGLKLEHEAWISVFNKRATRVPSRR